MANLTFGEQVKIILSRRNMTIKELAEQIEEKTGKKMSRQNMTQRLARDNFQEQDMRMIAKILECPFQLSILGEETEEELEEEQIGKAYQNLMQAAGESDSQMTVGEFCAQKERLAKEQEKADKEVIQAMNNIPMTEEQRQAPVVEVRTPQGTVRYINTDALREAKKEAARQSGAVSKKEKKALKETVVSVVTSLEPDRKKDAKQTSKAMEEKSKEEPKVKQEVEEEVSCQEEKKEIPKDDAVSSPKEVKAQMEPSLKESKKEAPETSAEEIVGEVNPYTLKEYENNSVRIHPTRIGYVQVYNREKHGWEEMTEWAFLGYQEKKKVELGADYEPPIYLD